MVGTHLSPDVGSRSVGEGLAERLRQLGFSVRLTSRQRSRALRVADMVLTVWENRQSCDLVQLDVYSGSAFYWAECVSLLVRILGKPLVMTLHGGNLPEFSRKHPRRISRLLSRGDAVTAPSQYLVDALKNFRPDIQLIPNPLELGEYKYEEREKPKPRLVWLRTFHRIYNPELAVEVLGRIKSRLPSAHLTMIGPDKDGTLSDVRDSARRLGVYDAITFTGGVAKSEVPRLLATGDIFLNTTTIDNSPVSVLEAMACGLAIVSTNVGGMPYLIEREHEGLLVPPGDAEAMTQAVTRLLDEPGLALRLTRSARRKAEGYSWAAILPCWEKLFTETVRVRASGNA